MTKAPRDSPPGVHESISGETDSDATPDDTAAETYAIASHDGERATSVSQTEIDTNRTPDQHDRTLRKNNIKRKTKQSKLELSSVTGISELGRLLLDGIAFVRRHCLGQLRAMLLPLVVCNLLMYALAYASLVRYVVSPPAYIDLLQGGNIDIVYYFMLSEFRGFGFAILTLLLVSPWIGYRCKPLPP